MDWFDPTEKFLERGEVRYRCKFKNFPDTVHLFEIPYDRAIVFFPVFFEQNKGQKLMLSVISSRIFTRITREMR